MGKHTPGPWRVIDHGALEGSAQVVSSDSEVCYLSDLRINARAPHRRRVADATLIAAAPDLLSACKALLGRMRWDDASDGWVPNDLPGEKSITRKTVNAARAAIAKAEGR